MKKSKYWQGYEMSMKGFWGETTYDEHEWEESMELW